MFLWVAAASACSMATNPTLLQRIENSVFSYRARVVDVKTERARLWRRRPTRTRLTLAVQDVYTGDVPEVVEAFSPGVYLEPWRNSSAYPWPVLGGDVLVMTHETTPELRTWCAKNFELLQPGKEIVGVTPVRSYPLPPGPMDAYIDAGGLRHREH